MAHGLLAASEDWKASSSARRVRNAELLGAERPKMPAKRQNAPDTLALVKSRHVST